jgi:hypothetical protein
MSTYGLMRVSRVTHCRTRDDRKSTLWCVVVDWRVKRVIQGCSRDCGDGSGRRDLGVLSVPSSTIIGASLARPRIRPFPLYAFTRQLPTSGTVVFSSISSAILGGGDWDATVTMILVCKSGVL